jgi:hypothetical protein
MERHTIPQLNVPDYVFSFAGFDISVRQFLLLVLGLLLCLNVWPVLAFAGDEGSMIRWLLESPPMLLAVAFGWVRVGGRPLEERLFLMLRFYAQPRVYIWTARARPEAAETPVSAKEEGEREHAEKNA